MDKAEAITALLGARQPPPTEDVSKEVAQWENARKALAARQKYNIRLAAPAPLPADITLQADSFLKRADVLNAMHGLDWQLAVADLENVLSFQKKVAEEAENRVAGADQRDWAGLFDITLPGPPDVSKVEVGIDGGGKAATVSSINPNLRVATIPLALEIQVNAEPSLPGQPLRVIGFGINLGQPFVQIAEYQGRLYVRDGYHRTYGLLRKGITRIPCIYVKARTFAETGAADAAFFDVNILTSDRPPFLKDFLDDTVAATASDDAAVKVVRVSVQEFLVKAHSF